MAMIKRGRVTQQDLESVVTDHGVPLAQIAREAEIDRVALSKFRNHGQELKLDDARALLDWMRRNELWEDESQPPVARLVSVQSVRFCFPIAGEFSDGVVAKVEQLIEEGDARVVTLFRSIVERNDGFFGDGHFTEDFAAKLQEAFAILGSNYVLLRKLRGWPAFGVAPDAENPETLRDVLFNTFNQVMVDAGLIATPEIGSGDDQDVDVAKPAKTEDSI